MSEIRNHDVVKVKSTNVINRVIDIHYAFDRYQIKGVSGWQYGINDLEKLNTDSLITTIESLQGERDEYQKIADGYANDIREAHKKWLLQSEQIESQNAVIEEYQFWIENIGKPAQALIKSQKEEIEKAVAEAKYQVELTLGFNQMYTDISLKLSDKNAEIESLKAITELAVTCLQRIDSIRESYPASFQHHHVDAAFIKAERLTTEALEEIERLQNG